MSSGRTALWGQTNALATSNEETEHKVTISQVSLGPTEKRNALDGVVHDSLSRVHVNTHKGLVYTTSHVEQAIANDGTLDFGYTLSTLENHCGFGFNAGGDALVCLYEAPTFTGGTATETYNNNRVSTNTTATAIVYNPSVTDLGTLIWDSFVPGGSGGNSNGGSDGNLARGGAEWILKPSTLYLTRITNIAGNPQTMSMNATFYEKE